ncbi:MAG: hypothetical protein QOF26_2984, partial [Baekduia sp.]|nr:hypothetical protein [Baekduia sp.]
MRRRKLLIGLMSAGVFTAGFSAAVFPASAQLRTMTVTLLGGETVTVQVDQPATTPAGGDALPGVSTPTSGTPTVAQDPVLAPTDTSTSSTDTSTAAQPAPPADTGTSTGAAPDPAAAAAPDAGAPTSTDPGATQTSTSPSAPIVPGDGTPSAQGTPSV